MLDADPSPEPLDTSRLPPHARLRSGTAARLAGLPVTTLRVWERRYGVVAAPKTDGGQRLYSPMDVRRLALLKRLSDRGHAIGTIATLPLEDLVGLAATAPAHSAVPQTLQGQRVLTIGAGAAHKLRAAGLEPSRAFADAAAAASADSTPDEDAAGSLVLLAHAPSLQPAVAEQLLALAKRWGAVQLVVLYAFGSEVVAESLRAAGAVVRREPCSSRELLRLLASAPPGPGAELAAEHARAHRFSDEDLMRLMEQPSRVACECPRHVAELVMQLSHFERYSMDCDAQHPADAALHRHLASLASAARTMFEQALQRVVLSNGLLPRAPGGA